MDRTAYIVGARIGSLITNNIEVIKDALMKNKRIRWLDRCSMEVMSACDLGYNWDCMAKGKILFKVDEYGEILNG